MHGYDRKVKTNCRHYIFSLVQTKFWSCFLMYQMTTPFYIVLGVRSIFRQHNLERFESIICKSCYWPFQMGVVMFVTFERIWHLRCGKCFIQMEVTGSGIPLCHNFITFAICLFEIWTKYLALIGKITCNCGQTRDQWAAIDLVGVISCKWMLKRRYCLGCQVDCVTVSLHNPNACR